MIALYLSLGCASHINDFALDRIVPVGMSQGDLGKACSLGEGLNHPLNSVTQKTPNKAMVIADVTAGLCDDVLAMEQDLNAAKSKFQENIPNVMDARIAAQRLHTQAARRYYSAYQYTEKAYGEIGEGCPKLRQKDEIIYLVGLVAGTLSVLHSRNGGNDAQVPDGILPKIARGAACLDNDEWWYTPQALQSAVWAFVPGSGPADVDAWKHLREAGEKGEPSGYRVAWGIHNLIAYNSGKDDFLREGVIAHGASIQNKPVGGDWALLDEYVMWVSRHQSDLVWISKKGHRTPEFGAWPASPKQEEPEEEDPFSEPEPDPFE
ncbi:MAG: hypothetical protein VX278_06735 [Myxococcota bacterium]|nr:hypothetical protein [Myxococcota bacterium]